MCSGRAGFGRLMAAACLWWRPKYCLLLHSKFPSELAILLRLILACNPSFVVQLQNSKIANEDRKLSYYYRQTAKIKDTDDCSCIALFLAFLLSITLHSTFVILITRGQLVCTHLSTAVAWREKKSNYFVFYKYFFLVLGLYQAVDRCVYLSYLHFQAAPALFRQPHSLCQDKKIFKFLLALLLTNAMYGK